MKHMFRVCAGLVVIAAGTAPLAGCMSSPTYGTNKTAAEQLLDDVGDAVAVISPKKDKNIDHEPRPGLVVPKNDKLALVEPQQSLANRENNPNWVESPEELRKRIRAEATAADEGARTSTLAKQEDTKKRLNVEEQKQLYLAKREAEGGAVSSNRRRLSDPPVEYREVADPSVLNDLGESEKLKEKRRKKEAEAAKQSKQWWDPLGIF